MLFYVKIVSILYPRRFKMGRSCGASFEFVTGNLVEESNGVPFEFFNGVKKKVMVQINV